MISPLSEKMPSVSSDSSLGYSAMLPVDLMPQSDPTIPSFGDVEVKNGIQARHVGSSPNKGHLYHKSNTVNELQSCSTPKKTGGVTVYDYRHYSPKTGQFLGRDPIGERGGVNLYRFVGNNSINRLDYLGKFEIAGGVGASSTVVIPPGIHVDFEISQTVNVIYALPPRLNICVNVSLSVGATPGAFVGVGVTFPVGYYANNSLEGPATSTTYLGGAGDGPSVSLAVSLNDSNNNITAAGSGLGPGFGYGGYMGAAKTFSGTSCFSIACVLSGNALTNPLKTASATKIATKQAYSELQAYLQSIGNP
jgi:RHS repeat-associated protein